MENPSEWIALIAPATYDSYPPDVYNLGCRDAELGRWFLSSLAAPNVNVPAQGIHVLDGAYVSDLTLVYHRDKTPFIPSTVDHLNLLDLDSLSDLYGAPCHIRGESAFIFKAGKDNYGHFLIEILPKLELLAASGLHRVPLIVPTLPESLRSILDFIMKVVYKGRFSAVKMESALVRTDRLYMPSAVTRHNSQKSATVLQFAARVSEAIPDGPGAGRKIYVSRSGFGNRILENEAELEDVFRKSGFSVIRPHLLPFEDQVRMFRAASVVAGPMGAALSSIVFCQPKTHIIMLDPGTHDMFFYDLSRLKHQRFSWIFASPLVRSSVEALHSPWTMNVQLVDTALRQIVS
ncbi:hypothetical protein AU375_03606 [Methylobacterium radiotolerans]|nr:hypothetical protein AU375_03606 [Methylobacterium radiotolerans]